jgi:outer membrane protein insertion porin family
LTADLRKLYGEGYFSDIRRSLSPSTNDPEKYTLKVEVDEKRTGSVSLGAGVDTMAGPFGTMGFSENNFQGKGQILSFHGMMGSGMYGQVSNTLNNAGTNFLSNQKTYQLDASWIEPNLAGTNTSMAVTGFGRTLNSMIVDQSQQQTIGATVNFSNQIAPNVTANLGFTGENVAMKDMASYYTTQNILTTMASEAYVQGKATTISGAEALAQNVRNTQLKGGLYASINPSLAYDTRDKKLDPTTGMVARLTMSPSLGITNASFMKIGASVSRFYAVTRETTLAFNVQGGAGIGAVPAFGQYMLGGFNGMRGYRSFSDLGTGNSMLMTSAEVRHRIPGLKNIDSGIARAIDKHVKLDAFFDAGQVGGNNLANSLEQRSTMGASVGVGIRVSVPMIGLIRLDYGLPLIDSVLGGMTPRLTVGFGDKF